MVTLLKKIYHNFLTVNRPFTDSGEYRKFVIVNTCLYVTCFTLLIFSGLHTFVFHTANAYISIIELISGLITVYAIWDVRRTHNIDRAAIITTITLFVFLLSFTYLNENKSFGLIWVIFFPIYAMTVNSPKVGILFTTAFFSILFTIAYTNIGVWQSAQWDEMSFIRLSIASIILTLIIYMNEVALNRSSQHEKVILNELKKLSSIDELTQIANRRCINKSLDNEIQRSGRYNNELCIALFDIDDFKRINDQYGHLVGDAVLQEVALQVKQAIRHTDLLGRWGGEEFLIILPQEALESTYVLSEKLRKIIENIQFTEFPGNITCSFGITQYSEGMTLEQFVEQSDKALYIAKNSGKNKVVCFEKCDEKRKVSPLANYIA